MSGTITAMVAEDVGGGKAKGALKQIAVSDLPDYPILVDVAYSSLNYKDGLAVTGKGKIARRLPLVLGIDLAGTIVESRVPDWAPGDQVLITGNGLSETEWGGYAQKARVKPEWLVRLPSAFSLAEAMAIGTAGFTAALAVLALERAGVGPNRRPVVVTGAAGGVGSVAVALLSERGYNVTASTGRPDTHGFLISLGAGQLILRSSLTDKGTPLQSERWAGAIDTVGGVTLANLIAQTEINGAVAACGLAGGTDLPTSVYPFILRGVSLLGINSVYVSDHVRNQAWELLARDLSKSALETISAGIEPLTRLPELAEQIIAGQIQGRVVIDVNK